MVGSFYEKFCRDGFAVIKNKFPLSDISSCLADIDKIIVNRLRFIEKEKFDNLSLGNNLSKIKKISTKSYLGVARQYQYLASLYKMSVSDTILDLLNDLNIEQPVIATRPVLHFLDDRLRINGGYFKTPAHQDWRSFQGSLDSVVIWLPMTDVSIYNYPLEVVRGSHKMGLLPSQKCAFGHCVVEELVEHFKFEPIEVACGDIIVMSGFLVHRTGDLGGSKLRISASFRYNNVCDPSFVERNFPNPYAYKPNFDILHPLVSNKKNVSDFFNNDRIKYEK